MVPQVVHGSEGFVSLAPGRFSSTDLCERSGRPIQPLHRGNRQAKFTVVDAGHGRIALHNPRFNRDSFSSNNIGEGFVLDRKIE